MNRVLFAIVTAPDSVALTWSGPAQQTGLCIERAATGRGEFVRLTDVGGPDTSFVDRAIEDNETYRYRLVMPDAGPPVVVSNTCVCTAVAGVAPTGVALASPAHRALGLAGDVTLGWEVVSASGVENRCDLYLVAADGAFKPLAANLIDSSYRLDGGVLERGRTIRWCVVARSASGAGVLSPTWCFSTDSRRWVVEGGFFFMGDRSGPLRHPGNPLFVDGFAMDELEVTNELYAAFLNWALQQGDEVVSVAGDEVRSPDTHLLYVRPGDAERTELHWDVRGQQVGVEKDREMHPVTGVTWFGADAYARALGRRLPSEAEWEKAARGASPELGDTTIITLVDDRLRDVTVGFGYPFPWGEGIVPERSNFRESGDPFEVGPLARTTPAGYYDGSTRGGYQTAQNASPYGVFDLSGNVAEWTGDVYAEYRAPHHPPSLGAFRVIRGGSWADPPDSCRNTMRLRSFPTESASWLGFRTVTRP